MGKPLKVLIVEDSQDDALLLLMQLRHAGYAPQYQIVETAKQVQAALDEQDWNIVISDYVLPEFSGLETLKMVRIKNPDIPCLIVSGKIDEETAVTAMRGGAKDYIMKDNLKRLAPAIERELAEAVLRQESRKSEEQIRMQAKILDSIGESVIATDKTGLIIYLNDAACKLFLWPAGEAIGHIIFDVNGPHVSQAEEAAMMDRFVEGEIWSGEFIIQRRDGTFLPVLVIDNPMFNSEGEFVGIISVSMDITEQKIMIDKLNQLYEAEKRQREELQAEADARAMFIDVLAHELRTPLTPILASSGMLAEIFGPQSENTQNRLVHNIYSGAQILSQRLEELLDLAKYTRNTFKINLKPTNIYKFIDDLVNRFKPEIDARKQQLVVELDKQLTEGWIDTSRLEQVIITLLSNASKFSPDSGKIIIKAKVRDQGLLVEVQDEGIGISPEEENRLFQPYHRVEQDRQKYPGIGLGLAVSKHIIEAHQGRIWLTSEPGRGNIFSFWIPLEK